VDRFRSRRSDGAPRGVLLTADGEAHRRAR
jgi:hypothetical protein